MDNEEIAQAVGGDATLISAQPLTGGVSATTHLLRLRRPSGLDWLDDTTLVEEWSQNHGGYRTEHRCLLHGDFWPGNVLWRHGDVAAIIDWEDAAVGDPLSDLACARLELACAAGNELAEQFTTAYFEATGFASDELALWDLYVATAALEFMDQWGLSPEELARRRSVTRRWQRRVLDAGF